MVRHVWERCLASGAFSEVWIATDDERIVQAAKAFGAQALLTSPHCKTGTDRVAEVAKARPDVDVWVNVQGDEPLIRPEMLQSLASAFEEAQVNLATLVRPLEENERSNPNVVKVVLARNGDALYFSRSDIPFQRESQGYPPRYAHLGLYGYRRDALLEWAKLPPSPLEETEKLEQLRALECGFRIRCLMTLQSSLGVDTPADLKKAEMLLGQEISPSGGAPPR